MSMRLETTDTPSARLALELSKNQNKVSMVSTVKGSGNRPPTREAIMQKREKNCEII